MADWLTNLGGAERVVEQMALALPNADIFTSVYDREALPQFEQFRRSKVRTSWLQKIPYLNKRHQLLLPFLPGAFENFDFSDYDLVLSSSFACAKGILTGPDTLHVCYCHNPTRYLWDESHEYLDRYPWPSFVKKLASWPLHRLRIWDRVAAERPDFYLANSKFVARRLQKYYQKESQVLYPGVVLPEFEHKDKEDVECSATRCGDYFLLVSRLTAQKHVDLVVEAFNELKLPLKIVGSGPARKQLEELNSSEFTDFLGFVSDDELDQLYRHAKALVFPQAEDFGLVPVEAQGRGCPVVAFAKGGALETVYAAEAGGELFAEQSVEALVAAVRNFKEREKLVNKVKVRKSVEKFAADKFRTDLRKILLELMNL